MYKLPNLDHSNQNIDKGIAFAYMDVNHPSWKIPSSQNMNQSSGTPVSNTLNQIYSNRIGNLMWSGLD